MLYLVRCSEVIDALPIRLAGWCPDLRTKAPLSDLPGLVIVGRNDVTVGHVIALIGRDDVT
jgi:hypothetical protein